MLETLRPNCERCDIDLPAWHRVMRASVRSNVPSARPALSSICRGIVPTAGRELVRRPIRPAAKLLTHPAKARTAWSYRRASRQNAPARCLPLVQVRPR